MLGEQQCDRISGGQERQLLDSIRLEQQRIRKIEIAMRDFKESTIETHYNVTIKSVPGCKILSLRKTVADYYCEGRLWEQLYAFVREEQVKLRPGINNLAIYHNGGDHRGRSRYRGGGYGGKRRSGQGRFLLQGDRACGGYGLYYGLWSI